GSVILQLHGIIYSCEARTKNGQIFGISDEVGIEFIDLSKKSQIFYCSLHQLQQQMNQAMKKTQIMENALPVCELFIREKEARKWTLNFKNQLCN
ncbi:hypothetical protein NQ315_002150, partial [Exocentrus adspersus]